jgi:hypothetical protein
LLVTRFVNVVISLLESLWLLSAYEMNSTVTRKVWTPASVDQCQEVKRELDRILASVPFRSSRRYPALLSYVVEKTLSGKAEDLKERTLGTEVFHRNADYDTNADPVVRFSAGEVRRRLAQFYQESAEPSVIEILLPTGSYIPQFFRLDDAPAADSSVSGGDAPHASHASEPVEPPPATAAPNANTQAGQTLARRFLRPAFLQGLLAGAALASVLIFAGMVFHDGLRDQSDRALLQVWEPVVSYPDTVLITAGRTHVDDNLLPELPNATIGQHILRPDARISISSVQAISQVAGLLQTQHKQFRVREAYANNLNDLHRRPVVLVSGFNNLWTMRLLEPLRFHLVQQGSLHYIVDTQHPERRDWGVDFDAPYAQQKADYAIVARFYDATTDGPVIVMAGIGSNGSEAAGEYMVSPQALKALANSAPNGSLDRNFEAVLKVEVIGGNTGAATVLAQQYW